MLRMLAPLRADQRMRHYRCVAGFHAATFALPFALQTRADGSGSHCRRRRRLPACYPVRRAAADSFVDAPAALRLCRARRAATTCLHTIAWHLSARRDMARRDTAGARTTVQLTARRQLRTQTRMTRTTGRSGRHSGGLRLYVAVSRQPLADRLPCKHTRHTVLPTGTYRMDETLPQDAGAGGMPHAAHNFTHSTRALPCGVGGAVAEQT